MQHEVRQRPAQSQKLKEKEKDIWQQQKMQF